MGPPGGRLESARDGRIGRGSCEGKVARSLLAIGDDFRQPRVERSSCLRRHPRNDAGGQQRVAEADPLSVELQQADGECVSQALLGGLAERCFDKASGRLGQQCDHLGDLARRPLDAVKPLVDELFEVVGKRQLVSGFDPAATPLDRPGELERVERVPARRLPQSDERGTRERSSEPRVEELVERTQAERAYLDLDEETARPAQPVRNAVAACHDCTHTLRAQASEREAQDGQRRSVEPVDVVYRDEK
jgi:hypothetical protein